MTNLEKFNTYLRLYAAKDIAQISEMFAADIVLRDWKIYVQGRDAAIAETRANFDAAKRIEIQPLHLYEAKDAVAGELRIVVDGNIELFVVDVLTFNVEGKIRSIRAFLGR
jgi:ketosteroid isomerase-like protein